MKKFKPYLLPGGLFLLAVLLRLIPGLRTIDDSFITFRYARNLLAGQGFVFNPGQPVMGTTTALYTLLMAGLGAIFGGPNANFPLIAAILNALADGATCVLLYRLGQRAGARFAGLATALIWAVAPFSVTFAIGGLETSLYVLLLTATAYAYLQMRFTWTAFLAGLAFLTRPDALILLLPLGLDWLVRLLRRRLPWPSWQTFAAVLLPVGAWLGFATLYFGSPVPHSLTAKLNAYQLGSTEAFVRLLQHYTTPFLFQNWIGTPVAIISGLILCPFYFIIGARALLNRQVRLWPWIFYPWFYFLVFALANPLIFRWYLTPPLPAYFFVLLFGLEQFLLGVWRLKPTANPFWRSALIVVLVVLLPLAGSLSDWRLHPDHGPDRPAPDMAYIQLELLYRQAADDIAPDLAPGSVLAAGDVGVLGYYTNARILDLVGLNSPEIGRLLSAGQI